MRVRILVAENHSGLQSHRAKELQGDEIFFSHGHNDLITLVMQCFRGDSPHHRGPDSRASVCRIDGKVDNLESRMFAAIKSVGDKHIFKARPWKICCDGGVPIVKSQLEILVLPCLRKGLAFDTASIGNIIH